MPPPEHPKADQTPAFDQSTFAPKATAAELKLWWRRATVKGGYQPFKVRVISNQPMKDPMGNELGKSKLTFVIARQEEELGEKAEKISVELPNEWSVAWSEFPSTAQFIKDESKERYGFLLLSETWAMNKNLLQYREDGGKWPIGAGSAPPIPHALQRVLSNEALRTRLLNALDSLAAELLREQESNE